MGRECVVYITIQLVLVINNLNSIHQLTVKKPPKFRNEANSYTWYTTVYNGTYNGFVTNGLGNKKWHPK